MMVGKNAIVALTFFASLFLAFVGKASGIKCYQCISTNNSHPFQCNEFLSSDIDIEPQPCNNVFGAQYCVKQVGRFEATSLDCYQCTSADEWKCMDGELVASYLQPTNCSHVYDAQYCAKSIGRYGGGIGTMRFCSAVSLGNSCDYVKMPGDKFSYRTCIYTCTGDGCNSGVTVDRNFLVLWLAILGPLVTWRAL